MWWSAIGRVSRSKLTGKREIPSALCADDKTVASAVNRQGIYAARTQLSCDSRCGPDIYSPASLAHTFSSRHGDGWQFTKVVGLAKDTERVPFPHTIKILDWGKRFSVHLRRDQLKTPDVSGDPGPWCWHLHPRGSCKHYTYSLP